MSQQMTQKTIREKISMYFKILCGGSSKDTKRTLQDEAERQFSPTSKKRRLTFALDRALIKLSRRNIVIEEFSSKQQLNNDLEKYISQRLASVTIAIFEGSFTEESIKTVFFPIQLLPTSPPPSSFISPINEIITNASFPFRKIDKGIQAYVMQVNKQICATIESTLKKCHSFVEHFVFLCEGNLNAEELHELFVLYKDEYMFEIERIMMLDKCVKNMVYISRSGDFLNIDRGSLIEFYIQELLKRDPCIHKYDFSCLLDRLFEGKLYVQVASIIGELMVTTDEVFEFDKEFIMMIQERYTSSYPIVKKYQEFKMKKGGVKDINNVPKFHENTPLFGIVQRSSIQNKFSETESVISRRNPAATHSFGRAISRNMGDWED